MCRASKEHSHRQLRQLQKGNCAFAPCHQAEQRCRHAQTSPVELELQARGSRSEHVGSELRAWGTRSTLACGGRADGSPNYFADLRLDVWHARACVRLSHAEEGKLVPK